ncbi:hypothetical protein DICSQDRAFT_167780 [Dichomitus squalens LYAD-421 SS1]|uniref:uncharacterized protein n=1 Tax=Dichomitus squalens (strain LYAD-421) TaxID=732165 RepID=UPI0004414C62|nr:uncharacterized protein DICSQDRAFT_167780 [Dichomitus squalens LYAD-421 SS1]EJF63731.1 hypothetical protein DICSQDRAFT_167780 [Dichomitus squalens LYAD-421 SS1]
MVYSESPVATELIPPLDPELLSLSDAESSFLRSTTSLNDDELRKRILDIQKRAYEEYPYPCVRAFHFVNLMMAANPIYSAVLEAGKTDRTLFLDLGCHMGTDLRKLVYDGYPASNVVGCDLRQEYFDFGYELFGDRDRCPIRFFAGNIFDLPDVAAHTAVVQETHPPNLASVDNLSQLRGNLTHIYTGALFHLFNEETQYQLAIRLALLLKRTPGAIVFGRHHGLEHAGKVDDHLGRDRYAHSETSWPALWKKVFIEVEGEAFVDKIVVWAKLTDGFTPNVFGAKKQHRMLYWSVQIV